MKAYRRARSRVPGNQILDRPPREKPYQSGMSNIFSDNSLSIGRTPLIELNRLGETSGARILAKIEGRNPAYSVKCRIGAAMIWEAEQDGRLKPGMEIIEPPSGNTGIALAYCAAARGYRLTLTMPESMSLERRRVLEAFGANLVLTDAPRGMAGAIEKAEAMVHAEPERWFMPQQFDNPANPGIHEKTTGPEIWEDTQGEVDAFVAGVGTGGTITGVTRYLKRRMSSDKELVSIAVEPEKSPVLTQTREGVTPTPGGHAIQGIGAGFVPSILELDLIDRVLLVSDEEAMETARRLAREEGILAGISCGAAVAACLRLAGESEFSGKTIVTVLPDSGERYLSTTLFQEPV